MPSEPLALGIDIGGTRVRAGLVDAQGVLRARAETATDARGGGLDERQSRAMAARRRQVFNRDEVDDLNSRGCLGEARDATLTVRPCDADDATVRRRAELVAQENADRAAILDWIASGDSSFADAGHSQLVDMYHRLLVANAKKGDWVEDHGGWMQK